MSDRERIRILLVEDDEDDFVIVRALFSDIAAQIFDLEWKRTFAEGLETMAKNEHDVCLVDYRLGAHNGVELLRAAASRGC